MKVLVIGNPIAGRGKRRLPIARLCAELRRRGHEVEEFHTAAGGDARRRAAQGLNGAERLVVVGGDGTVNEVLNGLADVAAVPLVLYSLGTANVLGRELGLPRTPAGVADLVDHGRVRKIDMGLAGDRRFLALVSAGFDSMVTEELARRRKGGLGFTGYIWPIVRLIPRYRPPELEVSVDGGPTARGAMVVVSHVRNYGGLFAITDRAACDSGHLDICVLQRGSVPALISYAMTALRSGLSRRRDVTYLTGTEVTINSAAPVPVEIDGDFAGTTPLKVRLMPAAVPVIVPE
jgi:diacylglycerol kinase (ATP)